MIVKTSLLSCPPLVLNNTRGGHDSKTFSLSCPPLVLNNTRGGHDSKIFLLSCGQPSIQKYQWGRYYKAFDLIDSNVHCNWKKNKLQCSREQDIFQYLLTISKPLYQCMRFEVKQVTKYKSHTLINVSGLYGVNLIFLLSRWPYIADYLDSWKTIIYFSYHYNAKYVTPGTL